jgi:hypothetical protein
MHFLFNLLRIKGLYMFRALLAHPQEAYAQTALGVLRACYVCWLHKDWSGTGVFSYIYIYIRFKVGYICNSCIRVSRKNVESAVRC